MTVSKERPMQAVVDKDGNVTTAYKHGLLAEQYQSELDRRLDKRCDEPNLDD
jgi:hypothetical protein